MKVRLTCEEGEATIEVQDTGDGIEESRLERIFEPKFTTKTHGLGLGLAMVRAIVKGAGGRDVERGVRAAGQEYAQRVCGGPASDGSDQGLFL